MFRIWIFCTPPSSTNVGSSKRRASVQKSAASRRPQEAIGAPLPSSNDQAVSGSRSGFGMTSKPKARVVTYRSARVGARKPRPADARHVPTPDRMAPPIRGLRTVALRAPSTTISSSHTQVDFGPYAEAEQRVGRMRLTAGLRLEVDLCVAADPPRIAENVAR